MNLASSDFELFDLPVRFALDPGLLAARRRALQAEVHPDRHAAHGAAAQRVAMQWAVRVDEAYRRLSDPLARAAYLCELQGVAVDAERNTAMPPEFLARQMEWREALDEAADATAVEALRVRLEDERRAALVRLEATLDVARDPAGAAEQVRALMFSERFGRDIERRLEALEQ